MSNEATGAAPSIASNGKATGKATAKGGENCGSISKRRDQDTGGMTVKKVTINREETKDFSVVPGSNGSTQPRISFDPTLAVNDQVVVSLGTIEAGTFEVDLTLAKKKKC